MVSQITVSLAKTLKLDIKQLQTLIPMEGAGGINVPYLGYVEANLDIPEVEAFNEDCLFLVVSDHTYGRRVPITVGTLHIDLIIEKATKEELGKISIAWGRGQLFRQIQARQVQLTNQDELGNIQGTVKLMKKVRLKPNQCTVPFTVQPFAYTSCTSRLRAPQGSHRMGDTQWHQL